MAQPRLHDRNTKCTVNIEDNPQLTAVIDKMFDLKADSHEFHATWAQQFRNAVKFAPKSARANWCGRGAEFVFFVLCLPWRIFAAFLPPKRMLPA